MSGREGNKAHGCGNLRNSFPLVSVLVGTRDRYQPLLRCLHSILNQDYPGLEVLVLDDYSQKHDVSEIVSEDVNNHRVKCFRSERQLGVAGGRNFLMQKAEGEVFIIVDDDAYFADTGAVSRIAEAFATNQQLA